MKVSDSGRLVPDHPDYVTGLALVAKAVGTADLYFLNGLIKQLVDASSQGQGADEAKLNFMLSVVKDVQPRDQLEAMLAAQMAAAHMASMSLARRLAGAKTIPQQDSAERAFNKLMRTFAMQMEALKRYRTGGEQKVTVQHVTVSEGGQAIVGNVTQTPRESASDRAAPAALTDARSAPMPTRKKRNARAASRRRKT